MNLAKVNKLYKVLLPMAIFTLVILAWEQVTRAKLVAEVLLPSPASVLQAFAQLWSSGRLFDALGASWARILAGFLLSVLISVPLGLLIGHSSRTRAALEPFIAFLRYIPPSAFIPLMIVWFGVSEPQKISVIFLAIAPYLCLMVADAASNTKPELIKAAQTLGAGKKDVFFKVVLPHTLPSAMESGRIMFGASWSFVIISEIVGSKAGLGYLILESQRYLNTANIFAAILIIGAIGIASDMLLVTFSKKMFPWFYHALH